MMIPLMVFTKIKQKFSQAIKDEYGMTDINFTSQRSNDSAAVFPFVFVNAMPAIEQGMDLYGGAVNGALFTFQIDVYDNKSQARARRVMAETSTVMKTMGFEIIAMPNFESTQDNTHRMTARFRRVIGANDKFMN
ncbi:MAG: hypothetical protein J6Q48_10560 [Bacteroidaceae bacterium]|nr:hypothetical protein [Bacteroidaceae bacterium]